MNTHHHHIANKNIYGFDDLLQQFGGSGASGAGQEILGQRYRDLLSELTRIVEYQWRAGTRDGLIKGFLLSGPPGTGKTTLAKRLALELALRFRQGDASPVVLAFIDGAEIARSRYGESEERIQDLFAHVRSGFTAAEQRPVVLFDDVESIFMARGSQHAKEWHFSQDSVFFHAVDTVDTSRSILILTTNRADLVDEAIRDRFLTYQIDYPDADTIVEIASNLASSRQLSEEQRALLCARLRGEVQSGTVRSLRDMQHFLIRHTVESILGKPTLAQIK